MADSKITALTAISTVDPTADPLVIVDVSDTSMAASGTTKKSTINQLLGAGGTATLASATITGDLTVDTSTLKVDSANNRVGIGTASPLYTLDVAGDSRASSFKIGAAADETALFQVSGGAFLNNNGARYLAFGTNNTERYHIASDGVATWSNVGGVAGTAMTLNATGLGVGASPSYKLHVNGTDATNVLFNGATKGVRFVASASKYSITGVDNTGAATFQPLAIGGASLEFQIGSGTQMTLDASGNLLVGSTSAFTDLTGSKEVKIGDGGMQTFASAIAAATPTNIARGGVGGLVYVGGFNGTGQYGAVVLWTSASATVVSEINNTGSTITFGVSAGFLQITSSLALTTVGANCIRL